MIIGCFGAGSGFEITGSSGADPVKREAPDDTWFELSGADLPGSPPYTVVANRCGPHTRGSLGSDDLVMLIMTHELKVAKEL